MWWGGFLSFWRINLDGFFCCYPLFVIVSPRAYRLKCSIVFVTWHLASSVCGVQLLPVPWWLGANQNASRAFYDTMCYPCMLVSLKCFTSWMLWNHWIQIYSLYTLALMYDVCSPVSYKSTCVMNKHDCNDFGIILFLNGEILTSATLHLSCFWSLYWKFNLYYTVVGYSIIILIVLLWRTIYVAYRMIHLVIFIFDEHAA